MCLYRRLNVDYNRCGEIGYIFDEIYGSLLCKGGAP